VDQNRVQITDKLKGEVVDTQEIGVSTDGKVLTIKVQQPGHTKANILVFERE
jgi:hypothetical protein